MYVVGSFSSLMNAKEGSITYFDNYLQSVNGTHLRNIFMYVPKTTSLFHAILDIEIYSFSLLPGEMKVIFLLALKEKTSFSILFTQKRNMSSPLSLIKAEENFFLELDGYWVVLVVVIKALLLG